MKITLLKTGTITIVFAIFGAALSACSTSPASRESAADQVAHAQSTQVEISYVLGHNQHRFTAQSSSQKAEVTTYLEKDIVQQADVDSSKYLGFVTKVVAFAQTPHRTPSQFDECRFPFSVTVKIDEKTYTSDGCRFSDEGGLSRLVRDGEFLLYSKK
jgi:hypothetical protein